MPHARNCATLRRLTLAACGLLVPLAIVPPAAAADLFYDATLRLRVGDDARFFLNLTNQQFAPPAPQAVAVLERCPRPQDDFPTVLFLAAASGRKPDAVLEMRLKGLPWSEILFRLQIPPDRLFAGLDRDPGPPYGNAWGHWKSRRGRDAKERFELSDPQIVELAKLQIAARGCGVTPYAVIGERHRGLSVEQYVVLASRPSGVLPARKAGAAKGARPARGTGHGQGPGQASHKKR